MTRTTVRRHAMALLLAPALALTACGGDDGGGGGDAAPPAASSLPSGTTLAPAPSSSAAASAPSAETATPRETSGRASTDAPRRRATPTVTPSAYKTLAACLQRHGVDLPELGQVTAPPPGFDPVKAQDALKSCMKFLEKPGGASAPR